MEGMAQTREKIESYLRRLETPLEQGSFGDPERFSLVDAAYAPLFMRPDLLAPLNPLAKVDYPAAVAEWAEKLASLLCVKASVVDDFPAHDTAFLQKKGAWLVWG